MACRTHPRRYDPVVIGRGLELGEQAFPDRPLPALDNRTPRECLRTAAGRRQVDLLLKNMEPTEHRGPGKPFDFSTIRRDLGLALR